MYLVNYWCVISNCFSKIKQLNHLTKFLEKKKSYFEQGKILEFFRKNTWIFVWWRNGNFVRASYEFNRSLLPVAAATFLFKKTKCGPVIIVILYQLISTRWVKLFEVKQTKQMLVKILKISILNSINAQHLLQI